MIEGLKVVAFDADDTLWSNEPLFREAERKVAERLSDYGFGVKAYVLSMIENAIKISGGRVSAEQIGYILESGREILHNPATPLPGVVETLSKLQADGRWRLVMLTKGELLTQEHKIQRSGLGKYFSHIEIVSDKSQNEYLVLCDKLGITPDQLLMVGNSFKSDIEPVLQLGGWGVHIPAETLWKLEHTEEYDHPRLFRSESISDLLTILA